MRAPAPPYADLSPDCILDAVAAVGLEPDGRMLALGSYENRVYQVGIEAGAPVVAKFYRPGRWSDAAIAEEHAFAAELAEAEVPVVAPLALDGITLHRFAGFRYSLYRRQGGREPELESAENLAWMGRLLARIHAVGARSRFAARGSIDVDTFIRAASRAVLESPLLPRHLGARYRDLCAHIAESIERQHARFGPLRSLRLHGDCHRGNVLWTDSGPHFVDLDDARMGPAVQDLWMLATTDRDLDQLLEGYAEFRDFDPAERQLIPALRTMRQIHWAGWVASRWHDPAFVQAFGHVAEARWWEQHCIDLAEAAEALGDEAGNDWD